MRIISIQQRFSILFFFSQGDGRGGRGSEVNGHDWFLNKYWESLTVRLFADAFVVHFTIRAIG